MRNAMGIILVLSLLLVPGTVFAQAGGGGDTPQLEILYYQWIQNDIIRNIEEIRRAKDPHERRDLVEDIEQIIFEKIEFPMMYSQRESTDVLDSWDNIGAKDDVVVAGEASAEAPEIAQAYALLGIAKGFEGFGAAAADLFEKAKKIYANVMSMTVSLDHNNDNRTLSSWIAASRGFWGKSTATRVTFYGKKVNQEVVDRINSDNIIIKKVKKNPGYTEYVAKRDFVRGIKRYINTDDTLKENKPNKFQIYLEPGTYELKSELGSQVRVDFHVSRNVNQNGYILETLSEGVSVYPIPDIKVFEDELRKLKLQAQQGDDSLLPPVEGDDSGLGDTGLGDTTFDDLDDEEPLTDEPPLE